MSISTMNVTQLMFVKNYRNDALWYIKKISLSALMAEQYEYDNNTIDLFSSEDNLSIGLLAYSNHKTLLKIIYDNHKFILVNILNQVVPDISILQDAYSREPYFVYDYANFIVTNKKQYDEFLLAIQKASILGISEQKTIVAQKGQNIEIIFNDFNNVTGHQKTWFYFKKITGKILLFHSVNCIIM
ncbi:MAG TPA: hypothetical protein LFV92_01905 [Rickettsia endosymbiont of Ceroptres masudai]|nr:hypothetical protein [Rickettsia endosymbiont of Ceroptres masudai]